MLMFRLHEVSYMAGSFMFYTNQDGSVQTEGRNIGQLSLASREGCKLGVGHGL